ncbi:MAG: O-antigen ligase family protein [Oceanicaulis sp.]
MIRALRVYEGGAWRVFTAGAAFVIVGGGLGAAPFAAVLGLCLLPLYARPAARALRAAPTAPALFAAAIGFAALSLTWSGYERPDQALKLLLATPLFVLLPFAALQLDDARARRLFLWFAVALLLAGVLLFIEEVFNAPISIWVKLDLEGYSDLDEVRILADRTLARGAAGFTLLAGPCALGLWLIGTSLAKAAAGFVVLVAFLGGLAFGVEANLLSFLAGFIALGFALRQPGRTLAVICFGAAAGVIAAPLLFAALLHLTPDAFADTLPLSWRMRLETWSFCLELIAASPIIGHGLDIARVLDDTYVIDGFELQRLPLHAHNYGLSIWIETGLVGALLFTAALIAAGRYAWRRVTDPAQAAGVAHALAAYLATVMVGSGVWQEWLHGVLALACALALMIRPRIDAARPA